MLTNPLVLQVAVPSPVYRVFDYFAPQGVSAETLKLGARVKVPWRKKTCIGILVHFGTTSAVSIIKLKTAIAVLDAFSLFPPTIFSLLRFAADYYHYPMGEVFAAAMPTLLRQGREAVYRKHYSPFESLPESMPLLALNAAQQVAVRQVCEKIGCFQPFLLFGVTGSGKTEVYLQVIARVLKEKKQALVLVPEIGLTPQTVERFQQRFPVTIAVLHSGLTDRERHDAWLQARNGDAAIVIGTRSAVFTPLKNPGVIVLDEEHDLSFKQQEGFRYSARDLAIVRAQLEKTPVLLGSATPSLESLHNVKRDRYQLLMLPERAGFAVRPTYHLYDLRKQPLQQGLSHLLLEKIQEHLREKRQVLLFLNRRGYAPTLLCHACGWIAHCKRCDMRMTLHQAPLELQCHHCGSMRSVDRQCPDCLTEKLFSLGEGTERIEHVLQHHFPKNLIVRIDKDSTRTKGALEEKLAIIHQGEPCILIGTQMLAKGHHFPHVTLAAIINADSGLFSADFRGAERAAQLILQVAGRAGRAEKPGEVVLQTYHPDHSLLRILLKEGYQAFATIALQERLEAALPPYQALALIRAEAIKTEVALNFLQSLKEQIRPLLPNDIMLLGPISAPMPKRAGRHRAQLLLQAPQRPSLKLGLKQVTAQLEKMKNKSHIRWSVDVDPQEMF